MAIELANDKTITVTPTITTGIYSVAFWVQLRAAACCRLSIPFTAAGSDELSINSGVATLTVDTLPLTVAVPADNAYHHIALVRSANNVCDLYLDGALVLTNTRTRGGQPINFFLNAGAAVTGRYAHFILWLTALTGADIAAQMTRLYPTGGTPKAWLLFPSTTYLTKDFSGSYPAVTETGTGTKTWIADPTSFAANDPPLLPPDPYTPPASAPTYAPSAASVPITSADNSGPVWVDVENASGSKLGSGPLKALKWTSTDRMDGAGKFSCELLATDAQIAQVIKRRVLRAWMLVNGIVEELGAGVIDQISKAIQPDGTVVWTVSGDDLLRELTWYNMQTQRLAYRSGDTWLPVTHAQAVTLLDYWSPPAWSFYAAPSPLNDLLYGQFAGESVLQAAVKIAKLSRTHFYRGTGRTLIFASGFQASGLRAVQVSGDLRPEICAIETLQVEDNSYDMVARVYPYGAGQGDARLTLAACTRTAPTGFFMSPVFNYIEHTSTWNTYGPSVTHVQFNNVTPITNSDADVQGAANALFDLGLEYLRDRTERQLPTYRISLAQCSRRLRPLQTIHVDYWDPIAGLNIDADLNILEATVAVDASGLRTTSLLVTASDRWPESDATAVVSAIQSNRQYQALPQLNANSYVLPFTKNLDDDQSNPANFRFRFDAEVTQVSRVTFDFQILPLESTVKSVSSATATSAANGDHTHSVTLAAHTHAVTIPNHSHSITLVDHTHNISIADHTHNISIADHTHNVSVAGHTHPVPNHQHNIQITLGSTVTYPVGFGAAGTAGGLVSNVSGSTFNLPTNASSGSTTASSGGSINQSTAAGGAIATSTVAGGAVATSTVAGGGVATSTGAGGGSSPTSDSGGGTTSTSASGGSHTHSVTPSISTVYGVFRDSAGNTFGQSDLEYSLDGTTWYGFAVGINGYASLGDSWYRIDLTSLLQNPATLRPLNANNLLRIRRKTAGAIKKATIDAQLNVRTIIQAMALN